MAHPSSEDAKVTPNRVATHWELSGAKPGKVDVVEAKVW